jgi:hypothetical protein
VPGLVFLAGTHVEDRHLPDRARSSSWSLLTCSKSSGGRGGCRPRMCALPELICTARGSPSESFLTGAKSPPRSRSVRRSALTRFRHQGGRHQGGQAPAQGAGTR